MDDRVADEPGFRITRDVTTVMGGLMLGMLVASLSMTLVAPAMPRIATELGGTQFAWWSAPIVALYALAAGLTLAFIAIESRVAEPLLPLRLWQNSIFTFSNSGTILVPMLLTMVVASVGNGFLIARTGRYKPTTLAGLLVLVIGFYLLTRLDVHSSNAEVVRDMLVIGAGLGVAMQTFTLIVQNSVSRADMGVATSATQLFRSLGGALSIAVMGAILAQGLQADIARHLPPSIAARLEASATSASAGTVLDPSQLAHLPPQLVVAVRAGIADALHPVFVTGVPFTIAAFVAALFIREIPLRRTAHVRAEEMGKEVLAELNQAGPDAAEPILDQAEPA
jgi:MFS family permease